MYLKADKIRVEPIELITPDIIFGVAGLSTVTLEISNTGLNPLDFFKAYVTPHEHGTWWDWLVSSGAWGTVGNRVLYKDGVNPYAIAPGEKSLVKLDVSGWHSLKLVARSTGTINSNPKDHAIITIVGGGC